MQIAFSRVPIPPISLPTKFELVINLTTAKALDIDVPMSLMVRADEMLD
jgi:putative ABC transport system substrate-binding protein